MSTCLWTCLGRPPQVAPCGARGTTDKGAEDHVRATQHSTVTGRDQGVLDRASARFKADTTTDAA